MARGDITVAVPLVGGIDSKTNAQVVLPTDMLRLENADFTKGGSSRARFGYRNVPALNVDGTAITDAHAVAPLNDGFILLGRQNAYTLDRAKNAWATLGPYSPMTHEEKEIAYSSKWQMSPDIDTTNGVTCVVWQEGSASTGPIYCQVIDEATGALLAPETLLMADGDRPHVTAVGGSLVVTWFDPATDAILARVIKANDVSGTIDSADITLAADAQASGFYDVCAGDGCMYLAFNQDPAVADRVRLFLVNPAGAVEYAITASSDASSPVFVPTLAWNHLTNKVFLCWLDNGADVGKVKLQRYGGSDLILEASFTEASASSATFVALTPTAGGGVTRWQWGGFADPTTTILYPHDSALAVGTSTTLRHCVVYGNGWFDGDAGYNVVSYDSSSFTGIQSSYWFYRDDGVLVGRALAGSASPSTAARPKAYGDNKYQVPLSFKRNASVNLDKITGATKKQTPQFGHQGIKRCLIDTAAPVSAAQVDGVLYTSGGMMWAIDGAGAPVEAQFQMFPDQIASSMSVVAGGSLTANSAYGYRVYYEWSNAKGQRVRSLALDLTVSTTANQTVRFVLRTLGHSRMQARSPVSIVVYRTMANQTVFYHRVSSSDPNTTGTNGYIANVTSASTITWDDAMADTTAEQKEIDYRTEGETDHFAFDAPAVLATVGNRVFCGGGGEFPNRPQFSLLRRDGRPVETNDTWVVSEFPEHGGRLTGFADINGIPVVFKERAVYAVKGTGPSNARGAANDYQAQAVTTDVGCVEPRSIVSITDGVFFKSAKGIHLLDQSFGVTYIGAKVEAYNDQEITGAEVIPDTNQVVFLTSSGLTLQYDYYYKSWSTYTNHEGVSSAVAEADYAYLRNDGELYIREVDTYTDAGIPYEYVLRTAPLRLEDTVQGFHRLCSFQVLGTYYSPHTLDVSLYYNRDRNPYQTFSFDPGVTLDLDPWGDDEVWGDEDEIWGGDWMAEDYDFERKPKRQKHSTVSFEFRGHPGVSPGAGFELTELLLTIRPRGGHNRLPASRKQ